MGGQEPQRFVSGCRGWVEGEPWELGKTDEETVEPIRVVVANSSEVSKSQSRRGTRTRK